MRAFFDVEFIQGTTKGDKRRDFYSVGIVREDGQELHRISSEADLSRAGWWFKANVLKQCKHEPTHSLLSIRLAIQEILSDVTTLYTRDGGHDADVLRQVVDEVPPVFDLQSYWRDMGEPPLPPRTGGHHALQDARWHKTLYETLTADALEMYVIDVWQNPLRMPNYDRIKGAKKKKRARQARKLVKDAYFSIAA